MIKSNNSEGYLLSSEGNKIFRKYLDNPGRMYTGLEAKKYWKQVIFSLYGAMQNDSIRAGRWSAYGHFSKLSSVQNILQKHQIARASRVWVHPLLDAGIIDDLIFQETDITSFDVDKDTLNWRIGDIKMALLRSSTNKTLPELVILNSIAGMGEEIKQLIEIFNNYHLPILLISNEGELNLSLLESIGSIKNGSVIVNHQNNFWVKQLELFLDKLPENEIQICRNEISDLKTKIQSFDTIYLSFFIENRASSILEYHLNNSENMWSIHLQVISFLKSKIQNKINFLEIIKNLTDKFTTGNFKLPKKAVINKEIKSIKDAILKLSETVSFIGALAIPDIVFELNTLFNLENPIEPIKLSELGLEKQNISRGLHTFFTNQVATRPSGTIEVPTFYFNRVYSRYFCYSTEGKYWQEHLQEKDIQINYGHNVHPIFKDRPHLENVNFISKFLIIT